MAVKLYHGDIVYTPSADALAVYENSYIAVDSGKVEGIYPVIPEKYKHAECIDIRLRSGSGFAWQDNQ